MRYPSAAVEKQEEGQSLHLEMVRSKAKTFGVHQHTLQQFKKLFLAEISIIIYLNCVIFANKTAKIVDRCWSSRTPIGFRRLRLCHQTPELLPHQLVQLSKARTFGIKHILIIIFKTSTISLLIPIY